MLTYQTSNHGNESARISFVTSKIEAVLESKAGANFLDLGAGLSPFKDVVERFGGKYLSQDFSLYIPNNKHMGMQNVEWNYPRHDFVCDINDFEPGIQFQNLICTEVLEHVPDPIAVLSKISNLVETSGKVIITVPMLSLVHQAPHYYSSGLSVYWFTKWAPEFNLQIDELVVSGDFADLLEQELSRGFAQLPRIFRSRLFLSLKKLFISSVRKNADKSVLESGGFALFVYATKL
jgi:SAM-dependent methyltransferase